LIFPNKTTYSAGQPFVFRVSSVLTGAYVAGAIASLDEHNAFGLELTYVKGDETSLQVKVETSIDGGVTYGQQVAITPSGGTSTTVPNEYSFVAASFPASQVMNILITPLKADHVRVSVKATGGTPTGTVVARGIFGWV
jgi:hypothetical protein